MNELQQEVALKLMKAGMDREDEMRLKLDAFANWMEDSEADADEIMEKFKETFNVRVERQDPGGLGEDRPKVCSREEG